MGDILEGLGFLVGFCCLSLSLRSTEEDEEEVEEV